MRDGEFNRLLPLAFEGSSDPTKSLKQLKKMEKAFASMECIDQENICFAAYQLQGKHLKVRSCQVTVENDGPITWETFYQEFKDFFKNLKFEKKNEFTRLIQGNMMVAQHDAKFTELSHFAPDLVAADNIKVQRFEKGLRPKIHVGVQLMWLIFYGEVVNLAKIME
ncbi:uncharacterized protein [Elaeis guineensis]|uniref:uncharacterized protein n=1 Tax=Elaeis guineensis var. tenera TaxID=51953 RepID=UPI003C6D6D12